MVLRIAFRNLGGVFFVSVHF